MHHPLKSIVVVMAELACLTALSWPASAATVAHEEPQAVADAALEHSRQSALETAASIDDQIQASGRSLDTSKHPEPAPPAKMAAPQAPAKTAAVQAGGPAETNLGAEIHNAVKEGVRPVYEQLVESGTVDAWRELKADLGLNTNQWGQEGGGDQPAKQTGHWDAAGQDPGQAPRTALQAQVEREQATLMREKLIDQVTPWVIGLVLLYGLGYLAKLLYDFLRWKSKRRDDRRIARARRRSSHRSRHAGSSSTSSSSSKVKAEESS